MATRDRSLQTRPRLTETFARSSVETLDRDAAPPAFLLDRGAEASLVIGREVADDRWAYALLKRGFDIVVASLLTLVLLPFIAVVALLIRLDSAGPVFYRQQRLGKGARPFHMLKFRTMYVNSDQVPTELLKQNESTGPLFKMRHDPRITRVGRFLRRTSLDELPQLFNVIRGEMSLVGPRPPLPREVAGFESIQRLRLLVTPGMTGLWQVSGRSDLPFEEMVRLDLNYIDDRSFWLDVWIMLKTIPSVLAGRGAY